MANQKKIRLLLTAVLVLLVGLVVYLGYEALQPAGYDDFFDEEVAQAEKPRDPVVSPRTDGELDAGSGDIFAGGVERPARDLPLEQPGGSIEDEAARGLDDVYGATPPLDLSRPNPQMLSAVEAVRRGSHPERLSTVVPPRPYDAERFVADEAYRRDYMGTAEPGRVFATAQPGPGVQQLRRRAARYQEIVQGETVELAVWSEPGSPVTFNSFDLGRFENQLTVVTVLADDAGVARASFTAPPGTLNLCEILAGSPATTGQVHFTVRVLPNVPPGHSAGGGAETIGS
ncbi:MAG: hypothetical protein AAGI37_13945 [Planctomycetota bacterium]